MTTNVGTIEYTVDAKTERLLVAQRKAEDSFDKIEQGAKRTDKSVQSLNTTISNLSKAVNIGMMVMAAKKFLEIADNVNLLRARVTRLSSGIADAKSNFDGIIQISNRTGMSVQSTGKLWESLKASLQDTSATSQQVLQLTDSLQKIGRIGGSSSDEMSNALRQLGQSLTGGIVRAEEYNSVLENMPEVWRRVAKQMGISMGELRARMLDGKLTAEDVTNAILAGAEDIEKDFAKLPTTTDQAFNELKNNFDLLIDTLNQTLGVSDLVVTGIQAISSEVQILSGWFKSLASDSTSLTDKLWLLAGAFEGIVPGLSLFRAQAKQVGWFGDGEQPFVSTLPTGQAGVSHITFKPQPPGKGKGRKGKKSGKSEAERLAEQGVRISDTYNEDSAAMRKALESQKAIDAAFKAGKITMLEYKGAMKGIGDELRETLSELPINKLQEKWDRMISPVDQKRGELDPIQQAQNEWTVRKQMLTDLGATEQYMREQERAHAQEMLTLEWERYKAQSMSNQLLGDAVDAMSGSATNALVGLVNGTQSWQQALANIGNTILSSVIGTLVQMGAEWVKQQLIGEAASAAATAKALAEATALGSAWATPAYLANVATMGGAATVGGTSLATGVAGAKALGLAGARYNGGAVAAGSLYKVGEHGKPEIFQASNGSQYMIPGDNGRVIPNRDIGGAGGGSVSINAPISVYPQNGWSDEDAKKLQQDMERICMGLMHRESSRPGGMLQPRRK
ncbi:tape measure protein [Escherichia coli]|uniref:tape measure protein n=1 Tax=Escherichia coli TaxID=562 RepID=UPI0020CDCC5F|nr:tape measure protein [Escherichia coli]WCQ64940.1 tape measure protein [Escherichia coli]